MKFSIKKIIAVLSLSCSVLASAVPSVSIAPDSQLGQSILEHYAYHEGQLLSKAEIIHNFQNICSTYNVEILNQYSVTRCFTILSARALSSGAHCGSCGQGYVYVHDTNECVMC